MPSLTFVLPHWLYWAGLIGFPLFTVFIVRRRRANPPPPGASLMIGYMFLVTAGFIGVHRYYARNMWGLLYVLLFVGILYGNVQSRHGLNQVSEARNDFRIAEFDVERFAKAVSKGRDGAVKKLSEARAALVTAKDGQTEAAATLAWWGRFSGGIAIVITILLVIDAFLLPGMVRRCRESEDAAPRAPPVIDVSAAMAGTGADPTRALHTRFTDTVDRISGWSGTLIAYWSMIAVFVYYYEVVARYVFNSPTNWAHESMFLMFGMQYMIAGAYAFREDAHVRVDVIYMYFSDRAKAVIDIVTSIFFFIFAGTLLVTGWIFMSDSIAVFEVSFTEWAIQYWPVKITITLGAALILLQGIAKLIKDFILLRQAGAGA